MMRLISDECLSSFLASPLHLPSCSFVQQHIRPRMTTRGAIRRDSIVTHLSSSCIISSYFWMTLAPSGDSRHLAEKMRFHEASERLFSISSKWPILQNIVFLRRIWKCHRSDSRSRCMTRAKLFFFFLFFAFFFFSCAVLGVTHGWGRSVNLEKGVWIRCCSSWAHLRPPATAGMFLLTAVQPARVGSHYSHTLHIHLFPTTGQAYRCSRSEGASYSLWHFNHCINLHIFFLGASNIWK